MIRQSGSYSGSNEVFPLSVHVTNENPVTVPVGQEWVISHIYAKQFKAVINPLLVKFSITIEGKLPIEYNFPSFNLHLFPLIRELLELKIDPVYLRSLQVFRAYPCFPEFELLLVGKRFMYI